jgi:hypothetical protein
MLTDIYRSKPFHQKFVRSEMTKPDQTGPNRTGILNFQLVARPKHYQNFTFSIPKAKFTAETQRSLTTDLPRRARARRVDTDKHG